MNKNYITPQTEVMQLHSQVVMDSINLVHHSGGANEEGESGFKEGDVF